MCSRIGTDQPVTRKSEAVDGADGIVVADIVDIHRRAVAVRRDPAPHLARGGLVKALVEMLGAVVHRTHVTNEEAGQSANVHRRTERVIDEGVRPFILNRAGDRSKQDRVVRISIPIWITPNGDGHRRPIVRRIWEKRSAPGHAHRSNHRLTRNDVELVHPERLEVLRSITKPDPILSGPVIEHIDRIHKQGMQQASRHLGHRAATVGPCR